VCYFLDKQGVSRRVGFVRFDNNNTAQTAINALDGRIPDGEDSPISVKVIISRTKQSHLDL